MSYTYSDELYSDIFKDANGFRPRGGLWEGWMAMTADEKQEEWDSLCRQIEVNIAEERAMEDAAIVDFEAKLQEMIEYGAADRETAIRWAKDSYDFDGDEGYLEFQLGLPYGYLAGNMRYR
jgi:hypothetical protein